VVKGKWLGTKELRERRVSLCASQGGKRSYLKTGLDCEAWSPRGADDDGSSVPVLSPGYALNLC
jgi:hypothetical protein